GASYDLLTAFTPSPPSKYISIILQTKTQAFLHPIYKDKITNLYSLPLTIGSNLHSQNFLIDLNGAARYC
ncbi:unnamed protein product, partial [Brassica rapa subsp. narinosa]